MAGNFLNSRELLASQKGLWSMESVSWLKLSLKIKHKAFPINRNKYSSFQSPEKFHIHIPLYSFLIKTLYKVFCWSYPSFLYYRQPRATTSGKLLYRLLAHRTLHAKEHNSCKLNQRM